MLIRWKYYYKTLTLIILNRNPINKLLGELQKMLKHGNNKILYLTLHIIFLIP